MVGLWVYRGSEGRHVDRWLSSRAGWSADVLRDITAIIIVLVILITQTTKDRTCQ